MKVTVYILTRDERSLRGPAAYLKNRGWNVYVTQSLQKFVSALTKQRPDYMVISSDYPHTKITMIPQILGQIFSITIIGISETGTQASINALNDMGLSNKLFPPVTGPALERQITKIKKEDDEKKAKEEADEASDLDSGKNDSNEPGVIRLQGRGQKKSANLIKTGVSGKSVDDSPEGKEDAAAKAAKELAEAKKALSQILYFEKAPDEPTTDTNTLVAENVGNAEEIPETVEGSGVQVSQGGLVHELHSHKQKRISDAANIEEENLSEDERTSRLRLNPKEESEDVLTYESSKKRKAKRNDANPESEDIDSEDNFEISENAGHKKKTSDFSYDEVDEKSDDPLIYQKAAEKARKKKNGSFYDDVEEDSDPLIHQKGDRKKRKYDPASATEETDEAEGLEPFEQSARAKDPLYFDKGNAQKKKPYMGSSSEEEAEASEAPEFSQEKEKSKLMIQKGQKGGPGIHTRGGAQDDEPSTTGADLSSQEQGSSLQESAKETQGTDVKTNAAALEEEEKKKAEWKQKEIEKAKLAAEADKIAKAKVASDLIALEKEKAAQPQKQKESVVKNKATTGNPKANGAVVMSAKDWVKKQQGKVKVAREELEVMHFKHNNSTNPQSLIATGTQEALEKTVVQGTESEIFKVNLTTNAACIVVDSPKFSGYLVCAMAQDKKIDEKFIDLIKERLFQFLAHHGEIMPGEESTMDIKIKEVPFEDWALSHAEFLRKSMHAGEEVAMAFFPNQKVSAPVEAHEDNKEMVKIHVDEIREDVIVDFDMYVHLPKNNRFVLYVPEGNKFFGEQKQRLTSKGVTHLHMKKDALKDIQKYRAQNFLNDKIDEFNEKAAKEASITDNPVSSEPSEDPDKKKAS